MINKKMTRDEAEKAAKDVRDYIVGMVYIVVEGNEVIIRKDVMDDVAHFPFEPPHPELIIGDTHRFWDDNGDWAIGKLTDKDDSHAPYEMEGCTWYQHAEPYTLIDPAEHAELEIEHKRLVDNFEKLSKQHLDTCAEFAKAKEAEAKEAEAVLAELLLVCKGIVEINNNKRLIDSNSYIRRDIEKLEQLLK